jgi:hypothetical protein
VEVLGQPRRGLRDVDKAVLDHRFGAASDITEL